MNKYDYLFTEWGVIGENTAKGISQRRWSAFLKSNNKRVYRSLNWGVGIKQYEEYWFHNENNKFKTLEEFLKFHKLI